MVTKNIEFVKTWFMDTAFCLKTVLSCLETDGLLCHEKQGLGV